MEVVLDRPLTETEWDALSDPPGGRYEVLRRRLTVSPSSTADTIVSGKILLISSDSH